MDIPIPLRFFEKLNLFQEFRKLEREDFREWLNERSILSWAADSKRHRDLHTPLKAQMALDHPDITGPIPGDIDKPCQYILNRFGCLVMRGYATWSSDCTKNEIRFTRAGFLLGEIINEIEGSGKKLLFGFSFALCWLIFISGAVVLLGEAIKLIHDLWVYVISLLGYACR
jgi:hypothetical protein